MAQSNGPAQCSLAITDCLTAIVQQTAEQYRAALLNSRLLGVTGELQVQGKVIHVIAKRLFDHTEMLGGLSVSSRDFH